MYVLAVAFPYGLALVRVGRGRRLPDWAGHVVPQPPHTHTQRDSHWTASDRFGKVYWSVVGLYGHAMRHAIVFLSPQRALYTWVRFVSRSARLHNSPFRGLRANLC